MRLAFALLLSAGVLPAARVAIVSGGEPGPPARYGLTKLRESLAAKGLTVERTQGPDSDFVVIAGLASDPRVAEALGAAHVTVPSGAEGIATARTTSGGKPAVVICGSDDRGLMYA